MNNLPPGVSPQMLAALQQNPRVMQLMQRPGMMQKLAALYQNQDPSAVQAALMSDPDLQEIAQAMAPLMQNTMGGGLARPPSTAIPNAWAASGGGGATGAAAQASSQGTVINIRDVSHWQEILQGSGQKLLVADFFAEWCGPCKRIAPRVTELASMFKEKAVFVKVDVDKNRQLASNLQVRSMPTFHFYRAGQLIDSFKGADAGRLEQTIARLSYASQPAVKPSPYRHFPVKHDQLVVFKKVKYQLISQKLNEFNHRLEEEKNDCALSEADMSLVQGVVDTLQDKTSYHSSSLAPDQYKLMEKMLQWPLSCLPAVLNLVRMLVMYPHATSYYCQANTPDLVALVLSALGQATAASHDINTLLCLRVLINMFNRRGLAKVLAGRVEEVMEVMGAALSSSDKNVRTAYASLVLNFSVSLPAGAEDAKLLLLSSLLELLSTPQPNTDITYRGVAALGTLVFRDAGAAASAAGLDFPTIVAGVQGRDGDSELDQACAEVLKAIADPSA